jgi:hypothetical protein
MRSMHRDFESLLIVLGTQTWCSLVLFLISPDGVSKLRVWSSRNTHYDHGTGSGLLKDQVVQMVVRLMVLQRRARSRTFCHNWIRSPSLLQESGACDFNQSLRNTYTTLLYVANML